MKYTTFRNVLLAGGILAAAGGFFAIVKPLQKKSEPVISAPSSPTSAPEAPPPSETRPVVAPPKETAAADPPVARGFVAPPKASAAESDSKAARGAKTPLRELDRELLKLSAQKQGAAANKGKDVFPGRPYKVNVYVEGDRVVRAKVDLNRNGKWDEKWSFEPGGAAPEVKRQVSPDDDDTNYTLTYKIAGDSWVQKQ